MHPRIRECESEDAFISEFAAKVLTRLRPAFIVPASSLHLAGAPLFRQPAGPGGADLGAGYCRLIGTARNGLANVQGCRALRQAGRVEMKRIRKLRWLKLLLWGGLAYLVFQTGLRVSPAAAATMPSTNAFLFLFGLSSLIVLLSPSVRQRHYRYRTR
jgi:hypothetical protein